MAVTLCLLAPRGRNDFLKCVHVSEVDLASYISSSIIVLQGAEARQRPFCPFLQGSCVFVLVCVIAATV